MPYVGLVSQHPLHVGGVENRLSAYTAISRAFAWLRSVQIILDWYHLEKWCKEQLSLALKGRVIRNALLEQLRPCLWHGCVDRAIALFRLLSQIKSRTRKRLISVPQANCTGCIFGRYPNLIYWSHLYTCLLGEGSFFQRSRLTLFIYSP